MKIYTKIVIDMNSLQVTEEESHEYEGPIAECKGGGGSSGQVDFPAYMKRIHEDWMDDTGTDTIESSVTDAMNSALGSSPFASSAAYDPDTDLTSMTGYVTDFKTLVDLLSSGTTLDTLVSNILDDTNITAQAAAFDDDLSDQLDANVYPRFEAGMRDINSVMSSAFVIGRAVIEDGRVRESAKFLAGLRYKASGDDALRLIALKLQYQQTLTQFGVETGRIKIVAKTEEEIQNTKYDESDAKWDMEVFQYGSNVLASISGAAHYVPDKAASNKMQSAIGGALSGGAAGGMMGGPWGAGIGAVLGAAGGLLS